METNVEKIIPSRAIHPCETLKEELAERKISHRAFAEMIDMDYTSFTFFMNGKADMTEELAKRIEDALGIKAYIWMRLQERYIHEKKVLSERKQSNSTPASKAVDAVKNIFEKMTAPSNMVVSAR